MPTHLTLDLSKRDLVISFILQLIGSSFAAGPQYAFTEVVVPGDHPWALAVVVQGELSLRRIEGVAWDARADAMSIVDGLNKKLGLSRRAAAQIVSH